MSSTVTTVQYRDLRKSLGLHRLQQLRLQQGQFQLALLAGLQLRRDYVHWNRYWPVPPTGLWHKE